QGSCLQPPLQLPALDRRGLAGEFWAPGDRPFLADRTLVSRKCLGNPVCGMDGWLRLPLAGSLSPTGAAVRVHSGGEAYGRRGCPNGLDGCAESARCEACGYLIAANGHLRRLGSSAEPDRAVRVSARCPDSPGLGNDRDQSARGDGPPAERNPRGAANG